MGSRKYVGMDVHQASISVEVRDETGTLVMESVLETEASTLSWSVTSSCKAGRVALAQWTLQHQEHLVVLRPGRFGLLVHTLFCRPAPASLGLVVPEIIFVLAAGASLIAGIS